MQAPVCRGPEGGWPVSHMADWHHHVRHRFPHVERFVAEQPRCGVGTAVGSAPSPGSLLLSPAPASPRTPAEGPAVSSQEPSGQSVLRPRPTVASRSFLCPFFLITVLDPLHFLSLLLAD